MARGAVDVEFAIEIDRPVEEVFAYLSDPTKVQEWDTRIVAVETLTEGPLGPGTQFKETRAVMGRKVEQVVEVTEYEPPRRFAMKVVEGPVPVDGDNVLEPVDGRTRLHFRASGQLRGPVRLATPLVKTMVRRQMQSHYARMRERIESS